MNYYHLNIEERTCIYQYKIAGMSIREIAKALKRSPSTISRELKRNNCGRRYPYLAHIAQRKYLKRRKASCRKIKISQEVIDYLEEKINQRWSPEQIYKRQEGRIKDCPSTSTIYRCIHRKLIVKGDMKKLRRKGKFKRPQETRGRFNIGKRIKQRPKHVYKRKELGHWEADTVESGRIGHKRKSSYCFVTLAERKSRLYLAMLLPNRKQEIVTEAIIKMLAQLPSEMVKSITCDRGKEFAGYKDIEDRLNCDVYFADPYCAWQKGTNENSNGLLREFYPKGMDLSETDNEELLTILELMNNRPRKCIKFKTPLEVLPYNF